MNGLGMRLARQLNKLWGRKGRLFRDRYFKRELENPTAVRRALLCVLQNHRRHGSRWIGPDPCSSAPLFRGWKRPCSVREHDLLPDPESVTAPCSWFLRKGWMRGGGLLDIREAPLPKSAVR